MTGKITTKLNRSDWIALITLGLLAILYRWNLSTLPFHPDESTQIYMSKDFNQLFTDPLGLSWDGDEALTDQERIRAIDAPLAKYLIGAARGLGSTAPLEADWNWAASWEENAAAGALPTKSQLMICRGAVTLALLAGLWFFYLAIKKILPESLAAAGLILLGLNPLVLLHGRRAMSEGVLLFGIAFFLWAATRDKRSPWLIGLALGLAINAKHTAAGLLPAAFYAICLVPEGEASLKRVGARILPFILAAGLVTAVLNPFYWRDPIKAIRVGLEARSALAAGQRTDHEQALGLEEAGPLIRSTALLAQVYLTPPQTEEVGNYLVETRDSKGAYLANPLHSWGRGWIMGGIFLTLSLTGFGLAITGIRNLSNEKARNTWVWILAGLGSFLILLIPLPWQRYLIPLLPFGTAWAMRGVSPLFRKTRTDLPNE